MAVSPDPSPNNKKPNPYNSYLRYGGLAIQLLVTIGVCGWVGYRIDQWMDLRFPAFMLTLGFIGFAGIMYQVYRSIN